MKKNLLIALIVLVVIVIVVVAYQSRPPKVIYDEPIINIGAVLPLSGVLSFLGEGTLNGLRLAESHANSGQWGDLPFQIKIIAEDGAGVPKTSISAYQKLQAFEKVNYVLSTTSGACMALKPLTEQDGVLLFANASHPALTDSNMLTFRHSNIAPQEADMILSDLSTKPDVKRLSVVVQNDDYGTSFASVLESVIPQSDMSLRGVIKYDNEGFDPRVISQQVLAQQSDAVILVGVGKNLGLIIRRLREQTYDGLIYASLGFIIIPGAIEAAGEYADGVHYTNMVFDSTDSRYITMATDYQEKFGQPVPSESVITYNTIYLLVDTLKDLDDFSDVEKVAESIIMKKEFQGVGEFMHISDLGDILPQVEIQTHGN